MRETIFRGKCKETGEWVAGSLIAASDGTFIFDTDCTAAPREPDYHSEGMECGLEDRNITDRYEAMAHGWDCAVEKMFQEEFPIATEVSPETIGQSTGLTDRNGSEIFEGDVLAGRALKLNKLYKVIWSDIHSGWKKLPLSYDRPTSDIDPEVFEVVGNIYELEKP